MTEKDEKAQARTDVEYEVAHIIGPRTMQGGSRNGNMDIAVILDRASDSVDAVLRWAHGRVYDDIRDQMKKQGLRVVPAADFDQLQEAVRDLSDTLDSNLQDADTWLEDLDLEYGEAWSP